MIRQIGAAGLALLLLCSLPLWAQKKPLSKGVRFQGATEYTQLELLAAAGLKPDARVNLRDVKVHAKRLTDTGFFQEVKTTSDSKTVLFTLTPSGQLYPMHLENLPLTPGKELDTKLRERFPLYRGLLPAGGSVVDGNVPDI